MHNYYGDIIERINMEPLWYDQNGVPRYCIFTPEACPDIYADYVVLVDTQCQCCGRHFLVQMSWGVHCTVFDVFPSDKFKLDKVPHYGDPPNHPECPAGNTMNVENSKYVEFWRRGDWIKEEGRWVREL